MVISPIVASVLGSAVVRAASLLLEFLLAILLARLLGTSGYGIYLFALSVMRVLAIPAQAGMPSLVVRETASYHAQSNWPKLRGLLRFVNATVLIFSVVIGIVALAIGHFFPRLLLPESRLTLGVALLLLPFVALGNIRGATLRGLQRVLQGQLPENVLRPAFFLLILIIYTALGRVLQPQSAMFIHWVAALIAYLCGVAMLRSLLPRPVNVSRPEFEVRRWLFSAIPLSASMGMMVINNQASIVVLGALSAPGEVGAYGAAAQVAMAATIPLTVVNLGLGPFIARYYAIGEVDRIRELSQVSAWLLVFCGAAAVALALGAGDLILARAFGPEFARADEALLILIAGYAIGSLSGISMLLLNMTRGERVVTKAFAIAVATNILLNFALVPLWGLNGAAVATAVGVVFLNLMLIKGVVSHLNIDPTMFCFLRRNLWRA